MTPIPTPISVPENVLRGIDAVRKSGLTNMLMRPVVIKLAREFGFHEAANWIENNRKLYAEGVFRGFTVVGIEGGRVDEKEWKIKLVIAQVCAWKYPL